MSKLGARLARLESKTQGIARMFTVTGLDKDAVVEALLRAQGHDPTPRDLIVHILKFAAGEAVPTISVQPIGR